MPEQNKATITFLGRQVTVACDRLCSKAWGIDTRPMAPDPDDPEEFVFLDDSQLGIAPIDPGTTEGEHAKPASPDLFPNKWCVRQCERSTIQE